MWNVTGGYERYAYGGFFINNMTAIMAVIFLAFLFLIVLNYKEIAKPFRKISKRTWLILAIIFVVGFVLRNAVYSYGWGYDGVFYTETANSMFQTGLFVKGCAIGNVSDCILYHQVLFPAGFPFLIVLLYSFLGQNAVFGMMLTGFLGSLTIIVVFLIAYRLFGKEDAGLFSAIVFTLIPLEIMINGTGAVRPVSSFFMALSVLFFILAMDKNKVGLWSLFAITLSFTIYTRQENSVLLLPLSLLFVWKNRKEIATLKAHKIERTLKKCWLPIVIFFVSQIPVQHWILYGNVSFNGFKPIFGAEYFYHTAPVVLTLLFTKYTHINALFNPVVSLVFFSGIFFAFFGKYRTQIIFLWAWFVTFFVLNASYFLCNGYPQVDCIGSEVRYMTTLSLPYALISGLVLYKITGKNTKKRTAFMAASFIFILFTSFAVSGMTLPTTFMKDGRLDEPYIGDAIRAINKTGKDCLLFVSQSTLPNSDLLDKNSRKWIDIDLIMNSTLPWVFEEVSNSKCMVYISDYRCRDYRDEQCEFMYKNFDMELMFKENAIEAYRLTLKQQ
jgi:hypothetical protein